MNVLGRCDRHSEDQPVAVDVDDDVDVERTAGGAGDGNCAVGVASLVLHCCPRLSGSDGVEVRRCQDDGCSGPEVFGDFFLGQRRARVERTEKPGDLLADGAVRDRDRSGCRGGGGLCAVFRGLCGISPGSTCGEGEYRCGGKCYQRERAAFPACVFEIHGLISSASSSARVRLRCRHTQPEVLNRFILEYRQPLVVVTRALPLDTWEKGCTRRTFVMTARASSWSRPKRTVALTALRFLRGVRGSDDRTVLPTRPS